MLTPAVALAGIGGISQATIPGYGHWAWHQAVIAPSLLNSSEGKFLLKTRGGQFALLPPPITFSGLGPQTTHPPGVGGVFGQSEAAVGN